jgi:hypothetical protein
MTEHGQLARFNVRPCLTCHGESFCAECHATTPRGPRALPRGRP